MAIWTYWEQGEDALPPWLRLCLDTIRHHARDAEVCTLDRTTITRYLPDFPPAAFELPTIAARSDILRVRLLARYGGLWLDIDAIAFPALSSVFSLLRDHPVVSTRWHPNDITTGFVAARPGADLISAWSDAQDRVLRSSVPKALTQWGAFGAGMFGTTASQIGFHDVGYKRVVPIFWREYGRFLSPFGIPDRWLMAEPLAICLFNQPMSSRLATLSRADVLGGHRLVSKLIRRSLDVSSPRPCVERLAQTVDPLEDVYWRARAYSRTKRNKRKGQAGIEDVKKDA